MPLKIADKDYIYTHYKTTSVKDIAKAIKRSNVTVYAFMKEHKLQPFRQARNTQNHPFRAQNKKIENYVIMRKQANEKRHLEKAS